MKINKAKIDTIAVKPEQYPNDSLQEIAFAGRSNVGKSSFINSIVNKKNLARTSSKPGKTRTVNFYNINGKFRFVDLPGYGYARVSKKEKEKWGIMIEEYLNTRENLREVILIVDIRHKPTKDDVVMYNWIKHYGFGTFIVATKADKLSNNKINQNINKIQKELEIKDKKMIIPYSSENRMNKDIILNKLDLIL